MNVTSVVSLFPETKKEQSLFVDRLINSLLQGDVDPLKVEAQMCNIEQVVKTYRSDKRVKEAVLNEAEKYHKEELSNLYNAKFEVRETGVKYDYSACGHPEYDRLSQQIKTLSEEKKRLEDELKLKKESFIYTDKQTGEITEVIPPERSSTTSVVVTINR